MTKNRNYILDAATAERKMRRIALEVLENNIEEDSIILVGVQENGAVVAKFIEDVIKEQSEIKTKLIYLSLDKKMPEQILLSEDMDFDDKIIVLVDDVVSSGKTLLYALKPFLQFHPKKIEAAVLVGRSHNSFPIYADYVGISIATTLQEHIFVEVENEKIIGAYLL